MNIHCVNKAVLTIQKVELNTCQQLHVGGCTTPHTEFYSLGFSGYARIYIYIYIYISIAIQLRGETAFKGVCLLFYPTLLPFKSADSIQLFVPCQQQPTVNYTGEDIANKPYLQQ